MVTVVNVDFSSSRLDGLSTKRLIPQFFFEDCTPAKDFNKYLREKSLKWSDRSLTTNAEHLKEFIIWLENAKLSLPDICEDHLILYSEALLNYRKNNNESLKWNTINSRFNGALTFLCWAEKNSIFTCENSAFSKVAINKKSIHIPRSHEKNIDFLSLDDAIKIH